MSERKGERERLREGERERKVRKSGIPKRFCITLINEYSARSDLEPNQGCSSNYTGKVRNELGYI